MEPHPVIPRRRLGAELRKLREAAGFTAEEAASVLECSQSKISRLETGKGVPRARDVRDLLDLYGEAARARRDELLRLAADGQSTRAWWNSYRDVMQGEPMPDHLLRYTSLEQDAAEILVSAPALIPGLLQTEAYVRATLGAVRPDLDAVELDRHVAFRMRRQQVLRRDGEPLAVRVVVCESVLLRRFGCPDLMREQYEHLLRVVETRPHVSFRVVPLAAGIHAGLAGDFAVLRFADDRDQDVVFLEGIEGAVYLEQPKMVDKFTRTFAGIEACASTNEETRTLLARLARRCGRPLTVASHEVRRHLGTGSTS